MERKLDIIYEDKELLVCYKKCGVPVQSKKIGVMDLESMVKNEMMRRTGNAKPFVSPVHRLDQPVEGLVLFAKTKKAMANLSEQVKNHTADKYYLTVVEGVFEKDMDCLTNYLKKDGRLNCSFVVDEKDSQGKKSQLEYKVLETNEKHQLLEIHLLTGRHHQIRVQLSHAGHPILEDTRYNPTCQKAMGRMQPALCAYKLAITHPVTGERKQFVKKPEGKSFQEFAECIEKMDN